MELAAADLSLEEEAQLDDQSRAALVSARQVQQFEPAGDGGAAGDQAFVWLGFGLEYAVPLKRVRMRAPGGVASAPSTAKRLTA